MHIHPTAVVHPSARLGEGVVLGPYSIVGPGVSLGSGTVLDAHAVVESNARLGENCRLHSHAVIAGPPQDLKYDGAPSFVEIGDRSVFREFCTVNRGSREGMVTRVGSDCLLMTGVHVAHDCQIGNNVVMANLATLAGHVHVEDRVTIGGLAAFHQFVRVGRLAMVGGTAGVMQDVPPYCMVQGSPPATVRGLNRVGLMRNGCTEQGFMGLKQAFRLMFRRGMTKENAIAEIEASVGKTPEVMHFLDWLKADSRRGIMKGEPSELLTVVENQLAAEKAEEHVDPAFGHYNVMQRRIDELTRQIEELQKKLGGVA
ncbi:acyl-ACP--UDP-N-acetylglucosamine O-acyltransferase [bacterium]|nr:acyl-ACP--UDP-N-acetylglucosamine O-acyltransferase [bacterium]